MSDEQPRCWNCGGPTTATGGHICPLTLRHRPLETPENAPEYLAAVAATERARLMDELLTARRELAEAREMLVCADSFCIGDHWVDYAPEEDGPGTPDPNRKAWDVYDVDASIVGHGLTRDAAIALARKLAEEE